MSAIMTLEGPPPPTLMGFGDTVYTGIGPIDALLNSPFMLLLGIAAGAFLASPSGQKTFPKITSTVNSKLGLSGARRRRRR